MASRLGPIVVESSSAAGRTDPCRPAGPLLAFWSIASTHSSRSTRFCSPEELKARAHGLRLRARQGDSLNSLLVEAFALVREAAKRAIGQRQFDVQIVGGIAIHNRCIAELETGEGKTLVATMPAFLNALPGKGVHIVTVNDYLARRDAEWMGPIYQMLGLTVGCIQTGQSDAVRRAAYACDITYGTAKEFGFDFLRDELKKLQLGGDGAPQDVSKRFTWAAGAITRGRCPCSAPTTTRSSTRPTAS